MPDYVIGLDLGQSRDHTALLILERSLRLTPEGLPHRNRRGDPVFAYLCNHVERFPLGTSYTAIVEAVSRLVARPELGKRPHLGIDATGVGRAVVDLFLDASIDSEIHPVTITAGDTPRRDQWREYSTTVGYWVPKYELVSAVRALLETNRLEVVRVALADVFKRELLEFRVKLTASANETFEARSGSHDDLVLACAIAAWLGDQREIHYNPDALSATTAESLALARERQHAQQALDRQRHEDEEQRRLESLDPFHPSNDHVWVRLY